MLTLYVTVSIAIGLYFLIRMLLEDWVTYNSSYDFRRDEGQSFSYNWQVPSNWLIVLAAGVPFVNLFSLAFVAYVLWMQWSSRA